MAIKTGQATLNGLKYNLDDRDRVAAQTYVESNTGLSAGTGFDGTETYVSWVEQFGGIIKTSILVDLTGLYSDAAGDIIGENGGTANCNLGQVTTAKCGTIVAGRMTCLETPDGGEPDIDVYSADEATGAENAAVTGLTETALLNVGQDWIAGASANQYNTAGFTTVPAANQYLYLVGDGGGTAAVYTAGKFLIELWGTV